MHTPFTTFLFSLRIYAVVLGLLYLCCGVTVAAAFTGDKPKLLLIVDDVINQQQLNSGLATGLNLTYSFIPPSRYHPNSARIAEALDEYMVHLPLEALNYHNEEINTLHVDDDQQTLFRRIREIKQQYPKVQFINNHTGSRFTADADAMDKLLRALRFSRIQFIDSKTIADTATAAIAPRHGMPVFARDIFLDYDDDESKILGKVKQAIAIAKRQGVAIAICHPRPKTFAVLKRYRNLFNTVELIQPSQLTDAYQRFYRPRKAK